MWEPFTFTTYICLLENANGWMFTDHDVDWNDQYLHKIFGNPHLA